MQDDKNSIPLVVVTDIILLLPQMVAKAVDNKMLKLSSPNSSGLSVWVFSNKAYRQVYSCHRG